MKYLVYTFIVALAFCLGWCARFSSEHDGITKIDTIKTTLTKTEYKRDTLLIPYPMPYIAQFTGDSIKVGDQLVPKEQKVYSDSNYTAWVSGISPKLDSIAVYPRTITITNDIYHTITQYKSPRRLGIGIMVGYGIGKTGLSPYLGVGVSYRIY